VLQHLDTTAKGNRYEPPRQTHLFHLRVDNLLGLLQGHQPILAKVMLPTWGYMPLWSKDKLTLVQIFTDSATEEIVKVTVATRRAPWMMFASITEVERVD
jgi:hypothetical protein